MRKKFFYYSILAGILIVSISLLITQRQPQDTVVAQREAMAKIKRRAQDLNSVYIDK